MFLKAGLEDAALAARLQAGKGGSARHAVNLMHDSLEFILYEILQTAGQDVYKDGQNTIGINDAIEKCVKAKIDLPLMGTIRTIQKHRGDAKHHAQIPHEAAFSKMIAEFRIVLSRLLHEHFGNALPGIEKLQLAPYHTALFDSYRKYRTHNWKLALRYALGALLHKHRHMLGIKDDYAAGQIEDQNKIIGRLEGEIKSAKHGQIDPKIAAYFADLAKNLRTQCNTGDIAEAAEAAGHAYARLDEISPSIVIASKSREITPHLVQLFCHPFSGPMGWSKWSYGDTDAKRDWGDKLQALLRSRQDIVEQLGKPYYDHDDDRSWQWWELGVFDGTRWHTFHMDGFSYALSLESGTLSGEEAQRREAVAKLIYEEFEQAAAATPAPAQPEDKPSEEKPTKPRRRKRADSE